MTHAEEATCSRINAALDGLIGTDEMVEAYDVDIGQGEKMKISRSAFVALIEALRPHLMRAVEAPPTPPTLRGLLADLIRGGF